MGTHISGHSVYPGHLTIHDSSLRAKPEEDLS